VSRALKVLFVVLYSSSSVSSPSLSMSLPATETELLRRLLASISESVRLLAALDTAEPRLESVPFIRRDSSDDAGERNGRR